MKRWTDTEIAVATTRGKVTIRARVTSVVPGLALHRESGLEQVEVDAELRRGAQCGRLRRRLKHGPEQQAPVLRRLALQVRLNRILDHPPARGVDRPHGIDGIVSYADPLERRTAAGELYKRQHWGTIYQASNALYVGRSSGRTLLLAPNGTVISGRALTKIRKEERGWEYATRQLLALGAPVREFAEEPAAWVQRVERTPGFSRIRHDGNLTYVFGLTPSARQRIGGLHDGGLPYQKQDRPA